MAGGVVNARVPLFDLNGKDTGTVEVTAEWVDAIPSGRDNAAQPAYVEPSLGAARHGSAVEAGGATFGIAAEEQSFYEALRPVEAPVPPAPALAPSSASQGARTGAGGMEAADDAVVRVDASHRSLSGGARYAGGIADSVDLGDAVPPSPAAPTTLDWLAADRTTWPTSTSVCIAVTGMEFTNAETARSLVGVPPTVVVDLFSDTVDTTRMTATAAKLETGATRVAFTGGAGGAPYGLAFPVSGSGALAESFSAAVAAAVLDGDRDSVEKLVAIVSVVQTEGATRDVASGIVPLGDVAKGVRGEWTNEAVPVTDESNKTVGFVSVTTAAKAAIDRALASR